METESIHQLWDKLFKVVGDRYPDDLVRFICSGKNVQVSGKYEQEKITVEFQIADINFWVDDQGGKKLLNIEPYIVWADGIPAKVFTRNAIITKSLDYKFEVISVVLILAKEAPRGTYQTSWQEMGNQFHFPVITFSNLDEILQNYPPLAPFVLKIDRRYQDKVVQVVKGDKVLAAITVLVLNRLGVTQEEALRMFGSKHEDFKQALMEVPIMQDIFKEWDQRASRAKVEGKLESLMKILRRHWGELPKELQGQLEKTDSGEKLDRLIDLALDCASLDEFKAQLK